MTFNLWLEKPHTDAVVTLIYSVYKPHDFTGDVTESSWMTFRGELNPHQKQDILGAPRDDTCAPQMFFPERETPLTLRYEQRCPLRRWRAG